jgi:hypothetical protein
MIHLLVNGRKYSIEFRHVTKLGKKPELYSRAPFQAITTCVIIQDHSVHPVVAIGNAVCSNLDNFSRCAGRNISLQRALVRCGAFRKDALELLHQYLRTEDRKPVPALMTLSAAEKERRKAEGAAKRQERSRAREGVGVAAAPRGGAELLTKGPVGASLYDIPEGCICMGDGLFGMKCDAKTHAVLRNPPDEKGAQPPGV